VTTAPSKTARASRPPAGPGERLRLAAAFVLVAGLLLSLHRPIWGTPFLLDDFTFYDDARNATPASVFLGSPTASNYYRPLGREIYFALGRSAFGPRPDLFRVVNLAFLFATALGTMALAARWGGARAAVLAGAAYASLGFHRVTLGWVSGAQDLIAAAFGVLAAWLYFGRHARSAAATLFVGLFAKGSIAALPLVVTAFERSVRRPLRRTLALWIAAAAWALVVVGVRVAVRGAGGAGGATAGAASMQDVDLAPGSVLEGFRLAILSLGGLDQPWAELSGAWSRWRPPLLAFGVLALLVVVAWSVSARARKPAPALGERERDGLVLAALWTVLGAVPVAFVGHHFSAYYLTFAAVGFALGLGIALARAHPAVAAVALGALLTLHTVALGTRDYRIALSDPGPRGTPFVSAGRLETSARLLDAYRTALQSAVHERGTDVVLYRMTRELAIASGVDRAPRLWLGDSTLTLTPQSQFTFADDGRPRVFLRFDPDRGAFAVLPDSLALAMQRGETAMERGETAIAREWLGRALAYARPGEDDLERAELSNTYGVASAQLGDTLAARRAWETTLALQPLHLEARINLAMLEAQAGRLVAARERLLAILRVYPKDERARAALARVEQALRAPAP
jgi:tetratricopeptide (TPR) repeat protein